MKKYIKLWNKEELNIAISLIESGKNYIEIGEILNRSPKSIKCRLNKEGYSVNKFKDFNKYKIVHGNGRKKRREKYNE